ncbi:MAG TPA: MarR family transcriptional regulator [Steroidobacteraceae bacterium]|jgi:DNA-binding MarR family transcriptional regulator
MTQDIVEQLGHLALGSRFKRIGEQLQAQAQVLLDAEGLGLPASHFPLLAALDRLGPLSVGEIAEAVGVSQPGITRQLVRLEIEGLVKSQRLSGDRRRRPIMLTVAGSLLVTRARKSAWAKIETAVAGICEELDGPLLNQLAALEQQLKHSSLAARVASKTRDRRHARA